jgi:hypothetical protein
METTKNTGDVAKIRSDKRFSLSTDANVSYVTACSTFNAVVDQLKTADDIRKLWLLFGDSAPDDYVVETQKNLGKNEEINDEVRLLIESKRLAIVAKYIGFFTKNPDWKLSEYTFLSQAFKSRKNKNLSPDFIQFVDALLKGDTAKAVRIVQSIDLDNLGERFMPPGTSAKVK